MIIRWLLCLFKQKTAYELRISDWSSDVCSSDLNGTGREHSARYYLTRTLETRAVKAADAVAVICDGLRGDLIARGVNPAKIIVSPNGVDLDLFGDPPPRDAALAARLGLGDGDAEIGRAHV